MSLNKQLEEMRQASWGKWDPENRAIVERANRDLQESGILDRVVKVGEKAPDFSLKDAEGAEVSLSGLLERGPLVLSFYRGHW
jgi:AhpC/TSA family